MTPRQQVTRGHTQCRRGYEGRHTGEHGPRHEKALQGVCHMPEVQAANASEVTIHKHPYWTTMADDCDRHPGSSFVHQEQQVSFSHTGLFYQMGRCQIAPRPDSHKNHGRTGQAVLHIRHPRNRPLRPGSKLRKQHRPAHIGCIWGKKSHTSLYHPQCDGMIERFNRSLLQLLQIYVKKQEDWEQHLPLALYAYRTATHLH